MYRPLLFSAFLNCLTAVRRVLLWLCHRRRGGTLLLSAPFVKSRRLLFFRSLRSLTAHSRIPITTFFFFHELPGYRLTSSLCPRLCHRRRGGTLLLPLSFVKSPDCSFLRLFNPSPLHFSPTLRQQKTDTILKLFPLLRHRLSLLLSQNCPKASSLKGNNFQLVTAFILYFNRPKRIHF